MWKGVEKSSTVDIFCCSGDLAEGISRQWRPLVCLPKRSSVGTLLKMKKLSRPPRPKYSSALPTSCNGSLGSNIEAGSRSKTPSRTDNRRQSKGIFFVTNLSLGFHQSVFDGLFFWVVSGKCNKFFDWPRVTSH